MNLYKKDELMKHEGKKVPFKDQNGKVIGEATLHFAKDTLQADVDMYKGVSANVKITLIPKERIVDG